MRDFPSGFHPCRPRWRRNTLASCLSVALPLAAASQDASALIDGAQTASVLTVMNCNNDGTDSLREAVTAATDGTVVDMTGLMCSTITLASPIVIDHAVVNLTVNGPLDHALTITANYGSRVFVHNAEGTLTLDHLTITKGFINSGDHGGGCIYGLGSVALNHSTVSHCGVNLPSGNFISGGGIYAHGNLTLTDSVVSFNLAYSPSGGATGGGVATHGNLTCTRSSILNNVALGSAASSGGASVDGSAELYACTISDNQSFDLAGGLSVNASTTCTNSTISYNDAMTLAGGILAGAPLTLDHCTIAFNTAYQPFGAGVISQVSLVANSSIIANNYSTFNGARADLLAQSSFTGSHNLIRASSGAAVPADTISADPLLAPLGDNGGATRTHALLPGSPALDAGDNIHSLAWDQRGEGFPRAVGVPDIGAFEDSGVIFADGFE